MHGLGKRQRIYHGAVGLALLGGLLGTGGGGGLGDLGSLLGGLLGPGDSATAQSATPISGRLHMADQKLRKGCKSYSYDYTVTVPADQEYDLEIFVTDPRGVSQGSDVILSGADPESGTKSLTICRSNTVPGTFTLRGTLYTNDGAGPTTTTVVPADSFRLTLAKKHHKHKHAKHHGTSHKKRHH
ncbi:hypothetical protein P5P86_14050 [Nocardioides sp. BP30]|uniref:hypothetical protein n=1 Tax=Nocardioides sp. BP30 TaxID=3036374 RepID=UPI002468631E|nr:hypothetical protein [Nocardioides sp. BP30]WGL51084.1 hypothetical protein P5P86_14050 [Nocardioides sp. BP30]